MPRTLRRPFGLGPRCLVPRDLASVTTIGEEHDPREVGVEPDAILRIWRAAERLYRTGLHPALQICIHCEGRVVLHRALGHVRSDPGDPREFPRTPVGLETPFVLYSASKAITALLLLKLDEIGALHVEDRVVDYIPEFGRHGKNAITLRHVLAHRAGLPLMPGGPGILSDPAAAVAALCDAKPMWRAGRVMAYHAVSGGFLLGAVAERATGRSLRTLLHEHVALPLGLSSFGYGVPADRLDRLAVDAATGPSPPPPLSWLLRRALGGTLEEVVRTGNGAEFRTAVIPAGNAVATAGDLSRFYGCLAAGGALDGNRVFEERTIRRLTSEQSYYELDLTLLAPQRWGLGVMLGGPVSLFGLDTDEAFGHLGFTNILGWADSARGLGVAILDSGKPVASLGMLELVNLVRLIPSSFPKRA